MKFSLVMVLSLRSSDRAVDGGVREHLLHLVAIGLECTLDRLDRVCIRLAGRRPQADRLEGFLHLAVRERIAGRELRAERGGTIAGTREGRIESERRVRTGAPA